MSRIDHVDSADGPPSLFNKCDNLLSTETRSHSSHTHSHSNLTDILRAGLIWAQTYNILPDRLTRAFPRPGSDAILHMSPTEFEFRQTPINLDSDADLSSN